MASKAEEAGVSEPEPASATPHFLRQSNIAEASSGSQDISPKKSKRSFKQSVNKFFLADDDYDQEKWNTRNRRLWSRSMGVKVKEQPEENLNRSEDTLDSVFDTQHSIRRTPHPIDPLARRHARPSSRPSTYGRQYSRQMSTYSTTSRRSGRYAPTPRARKDSVLQIAFDSVKNIMGSEKRPMRKPFMHSRSFAPQSMSSYIDEVEGIKPPPVSKSTVFSDFLDVPTPWKDIAASKGHPELFEGLPQSPGAESVFQEEAIDDHFFDVATPTSARLAPMFPSAAAHDDTKDSLEPIIEGAGPDDHPAAVAVAVEDDDDRTGPQPDITRPVPQGWQSGREKPAPLPGTPEDLIDAPFDDIERWGTVIKQELYDVDNSDRRELGKGFVGRIFGREYKDRIEQDVIDEIEAMTEHRPYFTYWITFVQIFIYIFAVAVYGIAPWGFGQSVVSDEVMKPNLAIEKVQYFEQDNLWVGPRGADLIHLGAKYSPCMRRDENVIAAIDMDREKERGSACCVRNDGSGCMQAGQLECSSTLSTWYKWSNATPGYEGRTSGSVCGQDPKYCTNPASAKPFKWEDDITEWPICLETSTAPNTLENKHMNCELTGRPCCVGIQGYCIITSREYCEFRRGYFHEEATLCSQVSCMSEICGMIPFLDPERPDQVYRLWTSLFLHAGLIQLIVTILIQYFVMRDLEKLTGWFRICIIYIGSGIAGALSSAIFLPYHVEAGPAGSQFGLLACLFTEILQNWHILKNPGWALGKQIIFLVFLFAIGLLPYVDNYAHLVGFVFGFFLSFAFLPYITFNKLDKRGKIIGIVLCLITAIGLFALLIVLFYVSPVYNCPNCHYFTCIPITPTFCKGMEVKIGRDEVY